LLIAVSVAASVLIPMAAGAGPASAAAQASSPSGSVYQIPLESARSDAAPEHSSGTSGGKSSNAQASDPDGPYRSENNFGSSSEVPGAKSGAGGSKKGDQGSKAPAGDTAVEKGLKPIASSGGAEEPSAPGTVVLLLVVAAVALLSAVLAIRARRRAR
jgi:hypothetical protein